MAEPRLFHYTNGTLIELDRAQTWPVTNGFTTIGGEITLLYDVPISDYELDDVIRRCYRVIRTTPTQERDE